MLFGHMPRVQCSDGVAPISPCQGTLMTRNEMHVFITARVISRLSRAGARRDEALRELLNVSAPGLDDKAVAAIVAAAPELPASLYEKWVGMFADRLVETVPQPQLEELCRNTEESNAALLLLYSMFMESARMEKVMRDDIATLVKSSDDEQAALAGVWLKQRSTPTNH